MRVKGVLEYRVTLERQRDVSGSKAMLEAKMRVVDNKILHNFEEIMERHQLHDVHRDEGLCELRHLQWLKEKIG